MNKRQPKPKRHSRKFDGTHAEYMASYMRDRRVVLRGETEEARQKRVNALLRPPPIVFRDGTVA